MNTALVLPRVIELVVVFIINTIHTNVGVSNEIMLNVTSHSTINVSRTTDQKYICSVNGTTNNYTLDTSSIEVDGLTPDTVYSIGCVEVDDNGDYQCTEYNTNVVTGGDVLIYILCVYIVFIPTLPCVYNPTQCARFTYINFKNDHIRRYHLLYYFGLKFHNNVYICKHTIAHSTTVDPHLSEHFGTEGWSDMRNVQITEMGLNAL